MYIRKMSREVESEEEMVIQTVQTNQRHFKRTN